jgi:uncharacterized FlaG/YvyC family protein
MDVPAAGAAPAPTPIPAQPAPAPILDAAPTPIPGSPAPNAAAVATNTTAGSTASTTPGGAAKNGAASNQQTDETLSPVVAKLFNTSEQNVEVSFQIAHNPDEIVTVFTDRATGKEIVQFPSQALIALAEMYDKDAGNVLDKSV